VTTTAEKMCGWCGKKFTGSLMVEDHDDHVRKGAK